MTDRRPGDHEPDGTRTDPDGVRPDPVADGLRGLGRVLAVAAPPPELAAAVLARVAAEPVPRPSWWRRAWDRVVGQAGRARRVVVVAVVTALLVLAVATPAGARIAEWLGLGAVVVVQTPGPPADPDPDPGPNRGGVPGQGAAGDPVDPDAGAVELSPADARARAPFTLGVPAALGDPDRVLLSADGRVVTMTWADRPGLRLDQLAGEPSPYFVKRYYQEIGFVSVGGSPALWLPVPHPLEYTDPTGGEYSEPSRASGPSLVWQRGEVTLRLEGEPDLATALAVAESVG